MTTPSAPEALSENDELPGMLALQKAVADQKWPHTMDARKWEQQFNSALASKGIQPIDPGWIISWFANAIMAGYDTANSRHTRSLPDGEQAVRDAARYEWMLDEPEGAQHLLNLLKQKKGTKEDFGKMIDRIRASKAAALSEAGRKG